MKTILALLFVAVFSAASNCGTTTTPDAATAGDATPPVNIYSAACANLAAIGCADGTAPNCAAILGQMVSGRMTTVNLPCLTAAKDIPSAVACGAALCK